jgi:DNA-binding transcriptional LysR family regulator
VLFPRETAPEFHDALYVAFARASFVLRVMEVAKEWPTVAGMVAAGMGVTVAPASVAVMPRDGAVYVRVRDDVPVRLVAIRRDEEDPLARVFVDTIRGG